MLATPSGSWCVLCAASRPAAIFSRASDSLALVCNNRTHVLVVMWIAQHSRMYLCARLNCAYIVLTKLRPCAAFSAHAGQEEVEAAVRLLDEESRKLARSRLKYRLMPAPLYAGEQAWSCWSWGACMTCTPNLCIYACADIIWDVSCWLLYVPPT